MGKSKGTTLGLAAVLALLCVAAAAHANEPIALTEGQLDAVTAGLSLGVTTGALAGGGLIAFTNTEDVAAGGAHALPLGGNRQTGVAGGVAMAVSPGGSAVTEANAGGSVTGQTLVNIGIHGTVAGAGASLSIGSTFITGGIH